MEKISETESDEMNWTKHELRIFFLLKKIEKKTFVTNITMYMAIVWKLVEYSEQKRDANENE